MIDLSAEIFESVASGMELVYDKRARECKLVLPA